MRIFRSILTAPLIGLVGLCYGTDTAAINEQYYRYTLEEFTAMRLQLVADQATRLIFPFVLDSPGFEPTLKYSVKPEAVFSISSADDVKGQNVLVLENNQSPEDVAVLFDSSFNYTPILGQFFLSVNGYNLSIELMTSAVPSDQINNIVFDLSDVKRKHMINQELEKYQAQIDREYQGQLDALDEQARKYGMEYIADVILSKPKTTRVRIEKISDDRSLVFYAETLENYDDLYYVIRYEVTNDGPKSLFIEAVEHRIQADNSERLIEGFSNCSGRLERGQTLRCVHVSEDAEMMKAKRIMTRVLSTDGEQVISW